MSHHTTYELAPHASDYPDEIKHTIAGISDVWDKLGHGHSETVYQAALLVYLRDAGVRCASEQVVPITYRGVSVGSVRADVVLRDTVVELKVVASLKPEHRQQLDKYMKWIPRQRGILVNFPTRLGGSPDIVVVGPFSNPE